jgi:glycosyltransferase involved in cell wall biosynthesis
MELSSAITVCTPEWKQYVAERTRRNMRIIVIGHGVDGQFFVKRDVNRKRFGVPGSSFVVGLVGSKSSDRDCNRKGVDIFLDVAHRVSARIGQLHIVLGGPGWDRELAELRAAKISASATGYLAKSELPFLYSALDVYLLTSRVEGGPCTVFEAMSCQTPVVATRVGAVPELIENGVNGYLAAVDDVEALTAAVLKLSQTEGHRKTIGGNARRTILARGWDEMLSPLGDLYEELIAIRRSQITPRCCPIWMTDPAEVTHASAAADVLAEVVSRVRNRHLGVLVGLRRIREMLEGRPLSDIASGVRVLHGTSFKAEADR